MITVFALMCVAVGALLILANVVVMRIAADYWHDSWGDKVAVVATLVLCLSLDAAFILGVINAASGK